MKVRYQHICFNPHTTKHHFLKILAKKNFTQHKQQGNRKKESNNHGDYSLSKVMC